MNALSKISAALLISVLGLQVAWAQSKNAIETINVAPQGNDLVLKVDLRESLGGLPVAFGVANPARLAIDLPNTENITGKVQHLVQQGDLTSINVVQTGDRTRLVLNLVRSMSHDLRIDGRSLYVTLHPIVKAESNVSRFSATSEMQTAKQSIRDIVFRRGKDGEGRIVVDLAQTSSAVDVRQQGTSIVMEFANTSLPEHLKRRLDVTDFATPVTSVVSTTQGDITRITVTPKGMWEHNAYQTDNQFVLEVKPITENPNKLVQGSKIGYQGPPVSINYANGDVRALIRLMAEELGLDAVISETVTGSITLVLKDIPADQVMDIIFRQKGLDMRKSGKVLLIAPRDELAVKDKLDYEAQQQLNELEPLRMEGIQLNYQKATDVARLLNGLAPIVAGQPAPPAPAPGSASPKMLSKRGSVTPDPFTNTVFVNDIPAKIDEIRKFIKTIDVASRQVMIEARVVEATDSFNKSLGVRLNFLNGSRPNVVNGANVEGRNSTLQVGGGSYNSSGQVDSATLGVNLPTTLTSGGTMAFSLFNPSLTKILNLELAALETDGKGKVISSPRVVTANNIPALIEDGYEVPYIVAGTSTSPPTVSFKTAKLQLKTTPQITPEGRVRMKLEVVKDEPDWPKAILGNPPIKSTKVETDVVVDNGGTVVIGGVFISNSTSSTERVPFLGDLPYIGFLFKYNNVETSRKELLVFITPRVINEQLELR